jgi:hypothetical protein
MLYDLQIKKGILLFSRHVGGKSFTLYMPRFPGSVV